MPDRWSTLPTEVQAALDAYLAARGDDATWAAYVDGLGPGLALDVATTLCVYMCQDAHAAEWIRWCVLGVPEQEEHEERGPLGLPPASRSLDAVLLEAYDSRATVVLAYEWGPGRRLSPAAWTVTFQGEHWENIGRVSIAEWRTWFDRPAATWTIAWAVAACRALCHSWAPEWARTQEGR